MRRFFPLLFLTMICSIQLPAQFAPAPLAQRFFSGNTTSSRIAFSNSLFSSPGAILSWYNYVHLIHFTDSNLYAKTDEKLKEKNLFGTKLLTNLSWSSLMDSTKKTIYFADFSHQICQTTYFTKDAFHLLLRGNKQFEGIKAQIDPLKYSSRHLQKLSFGVMHFLSFGQNALGLGINLSLINISALNSLNIDRGSLFTSLNGDSLIADLQLDFRSSTSSKTFNPSGFSADFNVLWKNEHASLLLSVCDFGFVKWANALHYHIDTSLSLSGYDPLSPDADKHLFNNLASFDTLLNYSQNAVKISYTETLVPSLYLIAKYQNKNKKVGAQLSFFYQNLYLNPRLILSGIYNPHPLLALMSGILYDEFGKAGAFFEVELAGKQHLLRLGTMHLETLFSMTNGQNWYISYSFLLSNHKSKKIRY